VASAAAAVAMDMEALTIRIWVHVTYISTA
jgi:hypothetical protein